MNLVDGGSVTALFSKLSYFLVIEVIGSKFGDCWILSFLTFLA